MSRQHRLFFAIAAIAVFACLAVTLGPIVADSSHPPVPILMMPKQMLTACSPATPNWFAGTLTGIAACFVIILSARTLRKR